MKYVYMIDYIVCDYDDIEVEQVECYTQKEVLEELKWLSNKDDISIINVKLVEDKNRDNEEEISYTFGQEVIKLLGYEPKYMITRNKGEIL